MDLVATLKLNADEYLRGIDNAIGGWDKFQKQFDEANRGAEAWASSMISSGAALTAGITVPIVGVGAAALSMASQFQQADIAFTTMLGSAEQSAAFLKELKEFAASTPFEFPELQDAAKKMMALGFESQTVIPIMRTIGDAVAGLGGNSALIDRITLQLGQMMAKGKVAASEMKTLAEAGIPAWQLLADKIGVSVPEAMKMAEKGAITAAEAIPAILEGMAEKFGGMMEKQAQTAAGKFSNMKDQITFILADLGKSLLPFANMVMEFAKPMLEAIKFLVDGFAALPMPIQSVAVGLAAFAAAVGPILVALGLFTQGIIALSPLLGTTGLMGTLTALGSLLGPIALAVAAVAAAWGLWQLEPVQSALKSVWDTITGFWNETLKPFVDTVVAAGQAFAAFAGDVISSGLQSAWKAMSEAGAALWEQLSKLWDAFSKVLDALSPLLDPLKQLGELLAKLYVVALVKEFEILGAVFGFLWDVAKKLATTIGGALWEGFKKQVDIVKSVATALSNFLKPALTTISTKIGEFIGWLSKIPGVSDALKSVNVNFDNMKKSISDSVEPTKQVADATNKYSGTLKDVKDSLAGKAAASDKATDSTKALKEAVDRAKAAYQEAYKQFQQGKIGIDELSAAQGRLQAAQDALHPEKLAERQAKGIEDMNKRLDDQLKWFTEAYAKLEKLNDDLADSTAKLATALQKSYLDIRKSVDDMLKNPTKITVSLDERLPDEIRAAIEATKEIGEAYKTLSIESARALQDKAEKAQRAYETIRDSGTASARKILEAELAALKASIEAQRAAGEDISEAQKKRMEDLEKATKDSADKQKSVWGDFTKQVSTIFSDFAKNVTERIWDAFSGKGNAELAKQRADLERNLAERTADWEQYRQEVAAQLEEITNTHAEALAEEIADLNAALADKRQDYYDYVASVNEKLTEIRQSHTEELEEERQDLLANLAEKLEAYDQYAADIAEKIEEVRANHAAKLAEELADLDDSLADKTRSYTQYVQDINRKLARIGQDLEEQVDDETRETNRGIEDRRRAYTRYEADIIEKINNELAKGKDANQQQIADWRESLNERSEDLQIYLARAAEDLEEFKSDAQKRAQQEEEDLKLSLQRRTEEHSRYVAEVGERVAELTARHRSEEESQIADLVQNLARRRQEYERYVVETQQRIEAATRKHAEQQAKEEADLMASFNRRTAEWERYQRENAEKIEAVTRKHAEQQAKEEADLAASLARRQQEYDKYLADIAAGIADLELRHQGLAGTIGSLFTGVLSDLGQSITRFGVEYIEGVLWKKLKEVGTDILPELKDAFLSVFKKDGIIWNAIGDLFDFLGGLFKKTKDAVIDIGAEGLSQLSGWGISGAGSAAGAAGGVAGGGGSAAGAAAGAVGSGLTGLVGAIGSVATAVSSIVGNFQMAGMNKSLDLIERYTRYAEIHLSYILDKVNANLPKLNDMETFNNNTIAPAWYDLLSHLDNYLPRFATAMETNLPTDLEAIHTSVENTKGTIESMRDLLAEKIGGLISGFGEKLAPLGAGFKSAIDMSTSNLQSTLREIVNSDSASRNAMSSAFAMLGSDVRNVQNAIYSTNMSGAMLSELGMIRGELTQIKSLSQTQMNAKPSNIVVNVQAPVGTQSPQNFGYVAASALKSQFGVFF